LGRSDVQYSPASSALERLRGMRSRDHDQLAHEQVTPPGTGGFDPEGTTAPHEDRLESGSWDAEAAEVLAVLVKATAPTPHQHLLAALVQRGYDREAARAAIRRAQTSGWIQHDLVSGYVLSQGTLSEVPVFDV